MGGRRVAAAVAGVAALVATAATAAGGATKPHSPSTSTTTAPTTTTVPLPAPPPPVSPGGSVTWQPTGRSVVGQPVLYVASYGAAGLAWMHPKLVRPTVVPGAGDPGGPWPWGGQVAPDQRPFLVAAFNGGFKWFDFSGGVLAFGRAFRDLAPGIASFVVFADGSFTVGMWGRDVDPALNVVAVRQNLGMLVDGGAPTPAAGAPGNWGASVAGVATMRSGLGVDANGGLVWAGGRLSPLDLANALVAGGAVRGMQMDINPDWVNFNEYDPGPDGVVHGSRVYGATGTDRYLHPDGRDFVAIFIRGTVVTGSADKVGTPALHADLHI